MKNTNSYKSAYFVDQNEWSIIIGSTKMLKNYSLKLSNRYLQDPADWLEGKN
jgi:hypothetical protein